MKGPFERSIPIFIPTTERIWALAVVGVAKKPQVSSLRGPYGRQDQTTQIYEGTNQIQRVVIARNLLR